MLLGSEKVLGRARGKGSQKGSGLALGCTIKKDAEKGSQKGFLEGGFQKVPRTPPPECTTPEGRRVP